MSAWLTAGWKLRIKLNNHSWFHMFILNIYLSKPTHSSCWTVRYHIHAIYINELAPTMGYSDVTSLLPGIQWSREDMQTVNHCARIRSCNQYDRDTQSARTSCSGSRLQHHLTRNNSLWHCKEKTRLTQDHWSLVTNMVRSIIYSIYTSVEMTRSEHTKFYLVCSDFDVHASLSI